MHYKCQTQRCQATPTNCFRNLLVDHPAGDRKCNHCGLKVGLAYLNRLIRWVLFLLRTITNTKRNEEAPLSPPPSVDMDFVCKAIRNLLLLYPPRRYVTTSAGGKFFLINSSNAPFNECSAIKQHLIGDSLSEVPQGLDCRRNKSRVSRGSVGIQEGRRTKKAFHF